MTTSVIEQTRRTMSPVMHQALLDFARGEQIHGREMLSLCGRGLIELSGTCVTRLGQQIVDQLVEEGAK